MSGAGYYEQDLAEVRRYKEREESYKAEIARLTRERDQWKSVAKDRMERVRQEILSLRTASLRAARDEAVALLVHEAEVHRATFNQQMRRADRAEATDEALDLIREIIHSPAEFDDERLDYVVLQVGRAALNKAHLVFGDHP